MTKVAGVEPGQRRLNGPQTTGREYHDLSPPTHEMCCDRNIAVAMRHGTGRLADVHRPDSAGRFPVLIAASPYRVRSRTSVRQRASSWPAHLTSGCRGGTRT